MGKFLPPPRSWGWLLILGVTNTTLALPLMKAAPTEQNIIGMKVLESKETPGLGDKIGKDPTFLANFDKLDARLTEDGTKLQHAFEVVKPGAKKSRWQIDGITGATISSKAMGRLLNKSAPRRLPPVLNNLPRLKEGR
jgi:electron transport complex protein RnfG